LLYFTALVFNLLLLLLQLTLRLLILYLTVLQFIANHVSTTSAERATNCGSGTRMTHRGADYRASAGAQQSTHASTFFAL